MVQRLDGRMVVMLKRENKQLTKKFSRISPFLTPLIWHNVRSDGTSPSFLRLLATRMKAMI